MSWFQVFNVEVRNHQRITRSITREQKILKEECQILAEKFEKAVSSQRNENDNEVPSSSHEITNRL